MTFVDTNILFVTIFEIFDIKALFEREMVKINSLPAYQLHLLGPYVIGRFGENLVWCSHINEAGLNWLQLVLGWVGDSSWNSNPGHEKL